MWEKEKDKRFLPLFKKHISIVTTKSLLLVALMKKSCLEELFVFGGYSPLYNFESIQACNFGWPLAWKYENSQKLLFSSLPFDSETSSCLTLSVCHAVAGAEYDWNIQILASTLASLEWHFYSTLGRNASHGILNFN